MVTYARAVEHIRDAGPADAERLAEIHAISWKAAYRGLLGDAFLDELTPTSRLDWWISRLSRVPPRWAVLVVVDEVAVAGFVTIGHCDDDDRRVPAAGELFAMYLDPVCWGRGFGRTLLLAAEARLRADAYDDVSLWVLAENVRARRFYELGGWRADGSRRRMLIGSDAVTAVRYIRDLRQRPATSVDC